MRLFCSLQIIHITQFDTKFQIYDECLPNQFLQPANKSITLLGKTQVTTNDLKAKLHYLDTTTMQLEMINTLPTTSTKATPIHNSKAPFPQMIISKNLRPCNLSKQKDHLIKGLVSNSPFNPKHHLILTRPHLEDFVTPRCEKRPPPILSPNH